MHLGRTVAAELPGVHPLRGDRDRPGRDEAQRIRVGEVRGIDGRRQNVDANLHRRRRAAALVDSDGNVRAVEVWHNVRPDRIDRGRCLHPDRLGEPTVVPPVGKAPGDDVLAGAPRRIIDTDRDDVDVPGHDRVRGVEGEGRRATLVVAKVVAVEPDIRDVVGGTELQRDGLVLPIRRDIEILSIPGAVSGCRGGRIIGSGDVHRRPARIVEGRLLPPGGVGNDPIQRLRSDGEGQVMVHGRRLNPPAAAQLEPAPRLVGKGRHRDPVLKGDLAPADRFQAQRRRELGSRLGADACRQKEPECDVNQDEAGEPAGRAQPPALSPPPCPPPEGEEINEGVGARAGAGRRRHRRA